MMKLVFRSMLALLVVLVCVVALRTSLASRATERAPLAFDTPVVDADRVTTHMAEVLRFATVSYDDHSDPAALAALRSWLIDRYPRFHTATTRTLVGDGTLVHEWHGKDASLAPIILMAHQDVVPVADVERWRHPPFSGDIADGAIWGRGAIDNKSALVGILEAAESLAQEGYVPERTLWFVFGHDEESVGGGARAAAQFLQERSVRAAFVLDEGGSVVAEHPVTGRPAALIAIAEKGMFTLELSVTGDGGHSSMPPRETAADILAEAIVAIKAHSFPPRYSGTTKAMLDSLAPHVPVGTRMAIANSWLFEPVLERAMRATPAGNAMLQTTIGTTMLAGSPKMNVLPTLATAKVNFRLLPGDTTESVIAHVREALGDLPVTVTPVGMREEPSPISSTSAPGYRLIAGIATSMFDAPVAPFQAMALTDSRAMKNVADAIYRFQPIRLDPADVTSIHGIDERISIENVQRAVRFYQQMIVGGGAREFP